MRLGRWIGFVALRYISWGRKNSPTPVLSILGIATGVLALTVIISVMNGFQLGFIENILEISSAHVRIERVEPGSEIELSEAVAALPRVLSVLPFQEINVLIRGRFINPRGALLRGVPEDAFLRDEGLAQRLVIEDGYFDLSNPHYIVLGAELARHLAVRVGNEVTMLSLSSALGDVEEPGRTYTVSGIFRSGTHEYDIGWGFVSMETAQSLSAEGARVSLGIKLTNRWHDRRGMNEIAYELERLGFAVGQGGLFISSWRDYNRAFFSALRTEKLMMFILLGLIFIVVGLNIFQAQRRAVLERREEIGLLRALGASGTEVRLVFLMDGFIIGLLGGGLGLASGLWIAFNIQPFFIGLERAVNTVIFFLGDVMAFFGAYLGSGEFAVFSPQIFYIQEIPSRVIAHEVALIFFFGFLSAVAAAWFASGKAANTRPAEVLRYE
ncbi:MAG: ABC transporter permease [Treponema sp.]|jgi:lipoprotein-releasing system permease protein|nr:ABC transporter permease [Treponema sp.]